MLWPLFPNAQPAIFPKDPLLEDYISLRLLLPSLKFHDLLSLLSLGLLSDSVLIGFGLGYHQVSYSASAKGTYWSDRAQGCGVGLVVTA